MKEITDKLFAGPAYHNSDPLVWLIGQSNEATFMVKGVETTVFIDTGAQVHHHGRILQ